MLFCENLNSTKLRMKHLGGKRLYGLCWVATQAMSIVPGVRTLANGHTGTEESEELRVTIASSAAIANGLWLDQLCCMDSLRLDKQM